jgi:hypothetical protein
MSRLFCFLVAYFIALLSPLLPLTSDHVLCRLLILPCSSGRLFYAFILLLASSLLADSPPLSLWKSLQCDTNLVYDSLILIAVFYFTPVYVLYPASPSVEFCRLISSLPHWDHSYHTFLCLVADHSWFFYYYLSLYFCILLILINNVVRLMLEHLFFDST